MTVTTTFRHMDATEALKSHADTKVSRLQKYLRQPMTARVTLSLDNGQHSSEIQVQSGSEWYEAKESCEDMYVAMDAAVSKLERQISHAHGVSSAKRRKEPDLRHAPVDQVAATVTDR